MNRFIPLLITCGLLAGLGLPLHLPAQGSALYPHFTATASYGFRSDPRRGLPTYQEHILRLTAGAYRSPRWMVAGTFQHMWRSQAGVAQPATYLIGALAQRHSPLGKRGAFYFEGGLHQGNHCVCEGNTQNPFRRPGLFYASGGLGLRWRLFPYTWATAGLVTHHILTRRALIAPLYGHTYFHFGLQVSASAR